MIITVDASQIDDLKKRYAEIAGQLPKVLAKGMTDTAFDAKKAVYSIMPRYLDRPTPWIMKSLFVFPAEKEDLRASVAYKHEFGYQPRHLIGQLDAPSALRSQIYGIDRALKSSEKVLRASGITSPDRPYLVPAVGAKKDRYGNVTGAFMNKVLYKGVSGGSASLNPLEGGRSQAATRSGQYFVLRKSGQAVGIYQNKGKKKSPLPVFNFTLTPRYRPRLPFHATVDSTVAANLDPRITDALIAVLQKYWSKQT